MERDGQGGRWSGVARTGGGGGSKTKTSRERPTDENTERADGPGMSLSSHIKKNVPISALLSENAF